MSAASRARAHRTRRTAALDYVAAWLAIAGIVWCDAAGSEGVIPHRVMIELGRVVPLPRACDCPACDAAHVLATEPLRRPRGFRVAARGARANRELLCDAARAHRDRVREMLQ